MAKRFSLRIGDHLKRPDSKRYYNQQVFGEIAARYDFVTRVLSFWCDQSWKRDLIAVLPEHGNLNCLDLACGTGDISRMVAERYPNGSVVGLDICTEMLEIARQRSSLPGLSYVLGDMNSLEYGDESLDLVTGGYALRNAPDLDRAVAEIRRVLKPGGTAAFLDFSKPRSSLAQRLEYYVLKFWTGLWGLLLHRNHEVYSYIAESLKAFPDRTALRQLLARHGLELIQSHRYFLGVTEILLLRRL